MDYFVQGLRGEKGESRTFEENKCYILAFRAYLRKEIMSANNTTINITWDQDFMVKHDHIHDLRMGYMEDGDIWIFDGNQRVGAAAGAKVGSKAKITAEIRNEVVKMVDEVHSTGKVVVSNMVAGLILNIFGIIIHRTTAGRVMRELGLEWKAIVGVGQERTYAAYRTRSIRDYLIALDRYAKLIDNSEDYVFIFTDESYVNVNHGMSKGFVPKRILR